MVNISESLLCVYPLRVCIVAVVLHPLLQAHLSPRPQLVTFGSADSRVCGLQGLGQAVALTRLGPRTLLQACPKALNYNWFLDCSVPEHNEVALMLIREAQNDELQNWYNLKLTGAHPSPVAQSPCTSFEVPGH